MKRNHFIVTKLCLAAVLVTSVILPLVQMFTNITAESIRKVSSSPQFLTAVGNSLRVATIATILSLLLAFALAFAIMRSNIRYKSVFRIVLTLPMLIPSISHGMGLIILFGTNGILTNMFNLSGTIYGFWGIVLGSVMYSFPLAFTMLSDVLNYEDGTAYEAAEILGISKVRRFFDLTLPYMSKSLVSVAFAVFTMVITDYGVPLMIGGNFTTLPVMMYQDVIGLLDFGKGSVVGTLLLLPAVITFLFDMLNKERGRSAFVSKPVTVYPSVIKDTLSYGICILTSVLVIVPIFTFMLLTFVKRYPMDLTLTFEHILKAFDMNAGDYLLNSLIISVAVSVVGTVIAYLTAYCTARIPTKLSNMLHLISITSLAIPGLVLGLSYVLFFKKSFLYGTLALLVLVNMVHFFASPYLMIYNTFHIINKNLEDVGSTLNISRFRILVHVLLPQTKDTLAEMMSYFFVNSMMTISAVSFLANVSIKPVALMITQFEAVRLMECSAFISLLILAGNLAIKSAVYLIKRRMHQEKQVQAGI